jgi:hypothetical protein
MAPMSDGTTTPTSAREPLLATLGDPTSKEAIRFGDRALDYRELAAAARRVVAAVEGRRRLAVFAENRLRRAWRRSARCSPVSRSCR